MSSLHASWQRHRVLWIVLLCVLVLMLAVRLALPSIIEKIVESKLESMPGGYQGTVEDVDVRMLDAEIGLRGFTIVKKNGQIPVPFMRMKEFVLGTVMDSWKPRTVLRAIEPDASFVDAESEAKKQKGPEKTIENLRKQLPFELLRAEVIDGVFHFRNYQTKPDMDLYAHHVNVVWDKLVGCLPPGSSACRSELEAEAKLLESGSLKAEGSFERKPESDFHVRAQVRNMRAPELNPFLAEYARIKMERGEIELDARYDRRGDRHDALLVPLLSDVEVEKIEGKDKSFLIELGVGAAAGWFERKKGEKGVAITMLPSGKTEFEIVDRPKQKSADEAKRD